ncbi:hypothetical protein PHJA_001463500 [Phtheirospermum japonicum]|uniref:Uncharacterized protein n=1 Tax=Phtheirospermum japonicum TaxID=374723 RepID=A0A830C4U8_9LAMI|nr:hypothetical protein PHJA_001463500 [Phtheirospermum japonicum]
MLHCAAGDKELGFHNLTTNQDFNYKLCTSLSNLYFCHLWYNGKDKAFIVYSSNFVANDVPGLERKKQSYATMRQEMMEYTTHIIFFLQIQRR